MYSKLLLVDGGGVVSAVQKGMQAANCANIIIGLGGTGTYCVRMIKTQAHARLRKQSKDVAGAFRRIKFLSVDTDHKQIDPQNNKSGLLPLDGDEEIGIEDASLIDKLRSGVQWMDWAPKDGQLKAGSGRGAGGKRPLGRLYLAGSAQNVISRIKNMYNDATDELMITRSSDGTSRAYIHVISGLGGGTGSGTFLDVCYLLKAHFPEAHIIGYFFLPQVNEDVVSASEIKGYIRMNGYAAMQDLDYCMSLGKNHGSLVQTYNLDEGKKVIPWDSAPVHLCHIIGNEGGVHNDHGEKAYTYAMNVVTEYIMDFLVDAGAQQHDLLSEINNADTKIEQVEGRRTCGYNCSYSSMGSACAIVPFREINTYLASRLFGEFNAAFRRDGETNPQADDVMRIACDAWSNGGKALNDVFTGILSMLTRDVNPAIFNTFEYDVSDVDWDNIIVEKELAANIGADIMIPREIYDHYEPQLNQKIGQYETNLRSMLDTENAGSLLGLIRDRLRFALCDVRRGPVYAYGVIRRAEKGSLINIIDGLTAQNEQTLHGLELNLGSRIADYNEAVKDVQDGGKIGHRKRCLAAEDALIDYLIQVSRLKLHRRLDYALREFRRQLLNEADTYYARLVNIYEELMATFLQNEKDIASELSLAEETSYAEYLLTMDQIKETLDAEIRLAVPNVPNAFSQFMEYLTAKRDMVFTENKTAFAEYVIAFFVDSENGLFNTFVNKTIDDYLRMAYAHDNAIMDYTQVTSANVAAYVQQRMQTLFNKARPLFATDGRVQDTAGLTMTGWVTVPSTSAAIQQAVARTNLNYHLMVNPSAVTDRIFVEMRHDGVSLSAIAAVPQYEETQQQEPLLHVYSGLPKVPGRFYDWGKLPPLTPSQFFSAGNPTLQYMHEYEDVFDKAAAAGLLRFTVGGEMQVFDITEEKTEALVSEGEALSRAIAAAGTLAELSSPIITEGLHRLETGVAGALTLLDTVNERKAAYTDPDTDPDGMKYVRLFYKDLFVKAPQIVLETGERLKRFNRMQAAVAGVRPAYEAKKNSMQQGSREMETFSLALFTGLFRIAGNDISYARTAHGKVTETQLSCMRERDRFPMAAIPVYQAYQTFLSLPAELKKEIWDAANDAETALFDPNAALSAAVAGLLAANRFDVWYRQTANFPDKAEIERFLADLYDRFENFKLNHNF